MEFTDRFLKCVACKEEFVFSAGEQLFFREKQFRHEPRHCKKCKAKHTNVAQARRNQRHLLGMRRRDHRSLRSSPGPAGLVPRLLSGEAP
jgi:hypothetical protein